MYQSRFEIHAPAGVVWRILTDLDRCAEWNPQVPLARGTFEEGEPT